MVGYQSVCRFVCFVFCGCYVWGAGLAQSSPLLPFQGYLTDANGKSIADGARVVQFQIFDSPIGGKAVWAGEVHKLSVNKGLVNTVLGSRVSLASVDFGTTLYLGITIDAQKESEPGQGQIGASDPPLLPRQIILPAVFAVQSGASDKLNDAAGNGQDWSVVFGVNDPENGAIDGRKLAVNSVPPDRLETLTVDQLPMIPPASLGGKIPGEKLAVDSLPRDRIKPPDVGSSVSKGGVALGEFIRSPGLVLGEGELATFDDQKVSIVSTGRPLWIGMIGGVESVWIRGGQANAYTFQFQIKDQEGKVRVRRYFNLLPLPGDPVEPSIGGMSNILTGLEPGETYTFTPVIQATRHIRFEQLSGIRLAAYEL